MKHINLIIRLSRILFCFLLFNSVFGQENYLPASIFELNGDTLAGYIKCPEWTGSPEVIYFRQSESNPDLVYHPGKINGFFVSNKLYYSAIIDPEINKTIIERSYVSKDTIFLQALFLGSKNLFAYTNEVSSRNFYIRQKAFPELLNYNPYQSYNNKVIIPTDTGNYIYQLKLYLRECTLPEMKINDCRYKMRDMTKLFSSYYSCSGDSLFYKYEKEKVRFDFGVLAGISATRLTLLAYLEPNDKCLYYTFPASINLTGGLFMDVVFPWKKRRCSIYNELIFNKYDINYHSESYFNAANHAESDATIAYSYLNLNNMFKYCLKIRNQFSIYANAGISSGFVIRETDMVVKKATINGQTASIEGQAVKYTRKYEPGYLGGVGAGYGRFSAEVRYEKGVGMTTDSRISDTSRIYLLTAYRF